MLKIFKMATQHRFLSHCHKTDASSSVMTLKSRRFSLQARAKFSRFGCRAHVRSLASTFGTTGYNWIQLTHIGPDKKEQGGFKTSFVDCAVQPCTFLTRGVILLYNGTIAYMSPVS